VFHDIERITLIFIITSYSMKQAGSHIFVFSMFKMILVLKELCTFHIGVKDMKIFRCTVIFLKKIRRSFFFNILLFWYYTGIILFIRIMYPLEICNYIKIDK